MKQQINLYQPIFRRQKKVFSALTMVQLLLFFGLVFVALYAVHLHQLRPFETELARVTEDVSRLAAEVRRQEQRLPATKSKLLEDEITRLSRDLDQRQKIQKVLATGSFGNTRGFSAFLEALARQHVTGTWVTKIVIAAGGNDFGFTGKTLASELVPQYLQQLADEQSMAGISFNILEVQRPAEDSKHLDFLVATSGATRQSDESANSRTTRQN